MRKIFSFLPGMQCRGGRKTGVLVLPKHSWLPANDKRDSFKHQGLTDYHELQSDFP
ncbi:MAG: hypothetical protein KKE39_10170 [Bacteroidetes bacterium]|nr:hypothetical protein [Bacteroidota bacterium]MBU1372842.1 hypothetical protein [Bacteroidota bacterium]